MPFTCNYHEADTRIVLHASKSIKPVIITATDTDVLVLKTACVKFYQNSIVLLVVIQPPTHLVLKNVSRLRKCVVSAKCICYMGKNIYSFKRSDKPKLFFQTILYSGKENKTFVSTRKQLYENQKYKTVPN